MDERVLKSKGSLPAETGQGKRPTKAHTSTGRSPTKMALILGPPRGCNPSDA